MWIKDIKN
ncbi:unnamed protein product [Acanthoscelides obtectus]|uniref:Uncharacterized protein n=1 Tax=Acanthoscelides obtectus TaxID=200917 RepID=A0A9P0LYI3_ACAOB|nr:unnamed protein product [Acanthoscelides obtectus]CAK1651341.1 hypothetical protein AOBTE_LOCUS17202 [Acanthoscelides obtectus]